MRGLEYDLESLYEAGNQFVNFKQGNMLPQTRAEMQRSCIHTSQPVLLIVHISRRINKPPFRPKGLNVFSKDILSPLDDLRVTANHNTSWDILTGDFCSLGLVF